MKKIITIILTFAMVFSAAPVFASDTSVPLPFEANKELGFIYAILTSPLDGSPFVSYFNAETGRVSHFSLYGESFGFRYVDDEADFWAFVAENAENTRHFTCVYTEIFDSFDRVNRNVSVFDPIALTYRVYDEYGDIIEEVSFSCEEEATAFLAAVGIITSNGIAPRIPMQQHRVTLPRTNQTLGLGGWQHMSSGRTFISVSGNSPTNPDGLQSWSVRVENMAGRYLGGAYFLNLWGAANLNVGPVTELIVVRVWAAQPSNAGPFRDIVFNLSSF